MIYNIKPESNPVIGVFLGSKEISVGKITKGKIEKKHSIKANYNGSEEEVLKELIQAIDMVFDKDVVGLGIGVPSLVDVKKGIVYKVANIPSWREVHLKEILENRFGIKVFVNNDANCFAVGEKYFGKAQDYNNVIGIIAGAGVGAGIIFNGHLYSGRHCGAGEFGLVPYRNHVYEYYCGYGYFVEKYGIDFNLLLKRVRDNDKVALAIFEQYGYDFGNLIKTMIYTIDPEIILIGGEIAVAFEFFEKPMWEKIRTFTYEHALENLKVEASENPNMGILGAAALFADANNTVLMK